MCIRDSLYTVRCACYRLRFCNYLLDRYFDAVNNNNNNTYVERLVEAISAFFFRQAHCQQARAHLRLGHTVQVCNEPLVLCSLN